MYDHASVTHYPEKIDKDFSRPIISSKKLCGNKTCIIGQREELSRLDLKDIETLYECGKTLSLLILSRFCTLIL